MQSYTSQDILKWGDRLLTNFADGDVATITYPNELHGMKIGKEGNAIAAHNEMGRIANLKLRLIKGSPDDKYLNSIVVAWKNHSDDFTPQSAEFTKVVKVDNGVCNDITSLSFIIPTKVPDVMENVEGNTEQAVSIYDFRCGVSNRSLA